jgi:prolyl 4-hydroxylase
LTPRSARLRVAKSVYHCGVSTPTPSEHLARAAALDATGNHDGAINELALGVRNKDPHCLRQLGLRLLTGDRGPLLPAEGLGFLGEACDAGLPEAAARAAALLALGVRVAPNWQLALAWLCRSAAGGWEPARRQLLALCDERALAQRAAESTDTSLAAYATVGAAIRLDDWRRAPPIDVKSADPRVCAFSDFIRPEICQFLISMADGRLVPARVYDPVNREDIVAAHRNNTVATFDVFTAELVHVLLQARMSAACGISDRMMEAPTVLHYSPGQEIQNHYDFVDPKTTPDYPGEIERNGQRIITFLVYLNEDYDGGETDFPKLGLSHKGRLGDALFFVNALPDLSPDFRALHAGRPTTRGEKWIVTQFIRSRPTR